MHSSIIIWLNVDPRKHCKKRKMASYSCILDECIYCSFPDAMDILPNSSKESVHVLADILTYNTTKDNLYICLIHRTFHYCGDYNTCIKDEQSCCRLTGKYIPSGMNKQTTYYVQPTLMYENTIDDIVLEKFNQHYFFQYIIDILKENNVEVQESDSLMALIVHLHELFYKHLFQDKAKQRTTVESRMKMARDRLCHIINVILEYILEIKIFPSAKDNKFVKSVYLMVSAYLVQGRNIHLSQQKSDMLKQWMLRQQQNKWL